MSSLAITQRLSPQQMSDLLKADRKDYYPGFFHKVRECAKAGIQLATIETFLREHHCKSYLIARDHKKSVLRLFPPPISPDGREQPYFLYIAMHPEARKEFKDEKENLQNLENTGFIKLKKEK
jgi:hypothetical protein